MTNFILGFHCHQPIGNFNSVLKDVHEKSYSPLVRMLAVSGIKFCFHTSGVLLEWWTKNDPEFIDIIAKGVKSGQIELLGGGYYEPILASIPRKDRVSQIKMLSGRLYKLFGKYPKGVWITERIWQPDIICDIRKAGLNYAFLDDFQFFQAGVSNNDIDSIFRTEYNGTYLDIFPIHERLRYKIPFAEPDESINEILYLNGRHSNLSVMFDDGEKMGAWPDTYNWVYGTDDKEGWLKRFIRSADSDFSQIKFKLPSDILNKTSKRIPVYLPISSYREMGEWTLPVEKRHGYEIIKRENPAAPLGAGIWHNFLTRYPEANLLHKRMMRLSRKINCAVKTGCRKDLKGALNELLKSQANDAYWHGVFGGIYLPHIRRAVHKALILSSLLYKEKTECGVEIERADFNMDGENEIQISNKYWLVIYKPSDASFLALDYLERDLIHSLGDVFCLHNEYDILKLRDAGRSKADAGNNGNYENPPRTIHRDAEYPSDLSEQDLIIHSDLLPPFEIKFNGKRICFKDENVRKHMDTVTIKSSGFVNAADASLNMKIKINKSIKFFIDFAPAINGNLDIIMRFAFPGGDGPAVNIKTGENVRGLSGYFEDKLNFNEINSACLSDSFWGGRVIINVKARSDLSENYNLVSKPLTTVSLSEKGFERIFQGIELRYSFNLFAKDVFNSIIITDVEKLKG